MIPQLHGEHAVDGIFTGNPYVESVFRKRADSRPIGQGVVIVVNVKKVEGGLDSRGHIKFGLESGPEGCPALRYGVVRLFETVPSNPGYSSSVTERVGNVAFKVRASSICIIIVRTKLGAAPKRGGQARIKDVVNAGQGIMSLRIEERILVADNSKPVFSHQVRGRHHL